MQAQDGALSISIPFEDARKATNGPANVTFLHNKAFSGGAVTSNRNLVLQLSWAQFIENYAAPKEDLGFLSLLQDKLNTTFTDADLQLYLFKYGCGSQAVFGSGGALCYSCSQSVYNNLMHTCGVEIIFCF